MAAWTGLCAWVFNVRGIAVNARDDVLEIKTERAELKIEREREKREFEARLRVSEQTSEAVRELAAAVRHGAEMTNTKLENLTNRFAEHATLTKDRLGEVTEEQRSVRLILARRNPAPRNAKT